MSDEVAGHAADVEHGSGGAEERLRSVVKDCVHCGFCLPACPTYQLWAEEMDSPRGRIYLVNQILDGAELTPASAPATATASSTGPSALTQNETRTTCAA